MCQCTEYKLSALQVRISEEYKLINVTTQQIITAKISGCELKQRSKTHSSLRQSNIQLQNRQSNLQLQKAKLWFSFFPGETLSNAWMLLC